MAPKLSYPTVEQGSHLLMHGADWATYSHFLELFKDARRVRVTYDRGVLEIAKPKSPLDANTRIFVSFVQILAEEWDLKLKAGGATTLRRKSKQAGLEPDECFWLANALRMAGRRQLDLRRDPPPDLAIEVDVRRSPINRFSLYARLGIPEIWRLRKSELSFFRLEGKKYVETPTSVTFDGLRPQFLNTFVTKSIEAGDVLVVLREFRAAIRKIRTK